MTESERGFEAAAAVLVERIRSERQKARADYWKEKHSHLRRRVRELVRSLPVDLPVPACNYRLIVAALTSGETESLDNQAEPGVVAVEPDVIPLSARNEEQFQRAVYRYRVTSKDQAFRDAHQWIEQGIDCVVVDFGRLGYGLLLRRAAIALILMDSGLTIVEPDAPDTLGS